MSISAIGGSSYFNRGTESTRKNSSKMNPDFQPSIGSVSSNITLNFSGTEESGNALTAVGFPDGSSASVYKADHYSQANPEYRVRYWDKEGNYTDTNVNIGSVNPSNASYLEMLAYTTYSDVQGMTKNAYGNFLQTAGGVNGDITYDADSINEKKDYMSMVKEFMQLQYNCNNLAGYMSFKELYDYMEISGSKAVLTTANEYRDVSSDHYELKIDSEAECIDIYDKAGNHLGAYALSDIEIKTDAKSGKQFLISEHGTMSYDALVIDNELKNDLCQAVGKEKLQISGLNGYEVKTHAGTGIQYLVRDGEEGRGGKVLLQSKEDIEKYNQLADLYLSRYPNLINSQEDALIYADLEIKGLAQRTENGIITLGFNGISYDDNENSKNNWSFLFSEDSYKLISEWFEKNSERSEISKISFWNSILKETNAQRIWSKEEINQGYLNN